MAEKKAAAKKAPAKKAPAKKAKAPRIGAPAFAWTAAIEDEIFKRISDGESLKGICDDDWLPSRETVRKRLIDDDAFAGRYARAREVQADTIFEEILEIADDARNDWMKKDGGTFLDTEHVQRSKLRIEARKWMAGKLRPKVYGEKLELGGQVGVVIEGAQVTFRTAPKGEE